MRLILRNVCKSLRTFVDQQEVFPCESIEIGCHTDYIRSRFNYKHVIYTSTSWRMPIEYENWMYGHAKLIPIELGLDHNQAECSKFKCFETLFSSIGRMVMPGNVKITVCGPAITVNMLSMLDPKTLHSIELKSFEHPDAPGYDRWSTEKVTQLTSQFEALDFTIDDIDRDSVSKLRNMFWDAHNSLDLCFVKSEYELDISLFFDSNSFVQQPDVGRADSITFHYTFPDVDHYYLEFDLHLHEDAITIRKLRR
ncbi:hypothetical protein CRE_30199 [Caenorhabditis remanei]|uniref:DUF38 domain-containing protein n=1 Tax=Caenorhabditis remanei TaxID=31234 RepID=E3NGN0_CAERE|nr:hypothetical protein CRE_30199 [Caenorhabditis remanei]